MKKDILTDDVFITCVIESRNYECIHRLLNRTKEKIDKMLNLNILGDAELMNEFLYYYDLKKRLCTKIEIEKSKK